MSGIVFSLSHACPSSYLLPVSNHPLALRPCVAPAQVLPILFGVLRAGDEALREEILGSLRALVGYVRQHMRRFLPELLTLIHEFWSAAPRTCLALIADLGIALRDDTRCDLVCGPRGRPPGA